MKSERRDCDDRGGIKNSVNKCCARVENEIYPTNAPENATKPYLVYMRITTNKIKTLEGLTSKEYLSFMFNIMAQKYSEMKFLTKRVEDFLASLPGKQIGSYYIEDVDINNVHEQYEFDLKVNRGIVDFTIYFEEAD